MSVVRFVQNFSRRRALVVSADPKAVEALSATLAKLGMTVGPATADISDAFLEEADAATNVLFVDGDLDQPMNHSPPFASGFASMPVVGLVGVEAPSRLRMLMLAGATAFLRKPVYGGSVYSALYLAVNAHAERSRLRAAVDELESRRRLRRHVIKAVVKTMRARGLDDDAAFQHLRREAMRARLSLETYCERLVPEREKPCDEHAAAPDRRAAAD